MYDEEVLSLEDDRLIDMAVRSLYIDLKEASSLVRESRSRMMAAGKLFALPGAREFTWPT